MRASTLYRDDTPIEEYLLKNRRVYVKREDLFGCPPAPPLGKLRGLRVVLEDLFHDGVQLVGCWDTRVSRLGEGLAAACREFHSMRAIVSYPTRKGTDTPAPVAAAKLLGADVLPLRGNHVSICYAQAKRHVENNGGRMLPFGLECESAVAGVAREAARTPAELACGTVVLCCGSGVTLAGLLIGLPVTPRRLIGLSSGRSLTKILATVRRYVAVVSPPVQLLPAVMPYGATPTLRCPFPTHPNYDLKAWQFLVDNIDHLEEPVLFWNIGA